MSKFVFPNDFDVNFKDELIKALDTVDLTATNAHQRIVDLIQGAEQPSEVVDARLGEATLRDKIESVDTQLSNLPNTIQNTDGIISKLIKNAQTYEDNLSLIEYGNSGTAYSPSITINNGLYQMDCSSFVSLMIHGVPFEKSRYNGNSTNEEDPLFFDGIDSYTHRLSNQIAKYAVDNGFAFQPNSDFSNLQAGDIVFYSWSYFDTNPESVSPEDLEFHNNAFMKIDHIGIFQDRKNEEYVNLIQYNDIGEGVSIYYRGDRSYMNQCVLAARFPFANITTSSKDENLLVDSGSVVTGASVVYNLSEPLKKKDFYSLFVEVSDITPDRKILIQTNNYATIFDDTGKIGNYKNGILEIRFPYLLDETTNVIRVAISGTTPTGTFKWASLYKDFKRNIYTYLKNNSALRKWQKPTFLNSWVENASHPVHYRIDASGRVYLRGVISGGTVGTEAFVLPIGYRPTQFMTFPSVSTTANTTSRVTVDNNGRVTVAGDTGFVMLNAVAFFID
jgi:hypothetical protein